MNISVAIIDDEMLARDRIRRLLQKDSEIHLSGEAKDAKEGLKIIREKKPELIFLDINMPGLDGFEMLGNLKEEDRPFIIFSTAYPEFALKAFDVLATDYLLKPYDEERFFTALNRAKSRIIEWKSAHLGRQLLNLTDSYKSQQSHSGITFVIKNKGLSKEIHAKDIYWFETNGNYVNLHLRSSKYIHRITLKEIANQLDASNHFLQIHRSIIINLKHVESHRYLLNNEFEFLMNNGTRLNSSKSFKSSIAEHLGRAD